MKSSTPEQYKICDLKLVTDMSDYVFELAKKCDDPNCAINEYLSRIGEQMQFDNIVVKEFIEDGAAIKCTYEWNRNGGNSLLGLERRFIDNVCTEWLERYCMDERGVYIYTKGMELPVRIAIGADIRSLLQIPMFNGGNFIGCIDFTDYQTVRNWNDEQIDVLKSACRIISNYLFKLRKLNDLKEKQKKTEVRDSVTELPFYEDFVRKIVENNRDGGTYKRVVVYTDITGFKYICSRYGNDKGTELLKNFAAGVYKCFAKVISCCRIYSDFFCFAVKYRQSSKEEDIVNDVRDFTRSVAALTAEIIPEQEIEINAGIYVIEPGSNAVDLAVSRANIARKYGRRNATALTGRVFMYSPQMGEEDTLNHELIASLGEALDNDEFKVFYQPKVNAVSGEIVGAEALVRWQKQDGSFVYPDSFIPSFEKDGCIVKVDFRVYDKVFAYIRGRLDNGLKVVPVSMNVSRVHLFGRGFVSYINLLLSKYKIPTEYLEFEITESVYNDELPMLTYTIEQLKSKGIRVSIDDFGSGYSSLNLLTNVPVDILKLDKVFLKEPLSTEDKIVISSVIDMASQLGLKVLCEGVETEEQREFLAESKCDMIQGYYFSKPVEEKTFNNLLENGIGK